jgi:hypothetical protein
VPDLSLTIDGRWVRYMGIIATALRPLASGAGYPIVIGLLATLGGAALAATAATALDGAALTPATRGGSTAGSAAEGEHAAAASSRRVVNRLAGLMLLVGWLMYGVTRGDVFDRYVLPFIVLMPFLLAARVPRWLLGVQALVLLAILVKLALTWLV